MRASNTYLSGTWRHKNAEKGQMTEPILVSQVGTKQKLFFIILFPQ